jgi:predicted dienelactone hydrolase
MKRLVLLLALCVGCGSEEDASGDGEPAPADPGEVGPYRIGVTTLETTSEGRTLPIEVWYPASIADGAPEEIYQVMLGALKLTEIPSGLGAVRDAKLDTRGAPYPVVLFSHGNGGMRIQSIYLTEQLASHGFVVAAPDHVGNTITEQVNQGGLAPAEAARVRPLDISRTLDAVLETSGELAGAADPARVGVAGHSFGGYTAFRLAGATIDVEAVKVHCQTQSDLFCTGWETITEPFPASARDERILAALPQTPGGAAVMEAGDNDGFSAITIPTFIQGGTTDEITPFEAESRAPYQRLGGPASLLGIENAGHFTYSNVCQILELTGLTLEQLQDGCEPADIPWRDAHALVNRFATAFFQVHVAGHGELAEHLVPADPLAPGVAFHETRAP